MVNFDALMDNPQGGINITSRSFYSKKSLLAYKKTSNKKYKLLQINIFKKEDNNV